MQAIELLPLRVNDLKQFEYCPRIVFYNTVMPLDRKVTFKMQRGTEAEFHLDALEHFGEFVEIEASNKNHPVPLEKLHEQCNMYMKEFGIKSEDLVELSYSDILRKSTAE